MDKESEHSIGMCYDISALMQYKGLSFNQTNSIADGISLIGYKNTDKNEKNIDILLSSQQMPFNLIRAQYGWSSIDSHIMIVVTADHYQQAIALLNSAAKKGYIDLASGTKGLTSF